MVRYLIFASLGALAVRPALGQEVSPSPAVSPAPHPASAIARSDFAVSQRDAGRSLHKAITPVLVASLPAALPAANKAAKTATQGLLSLASPSVASATVASSDAAPLLSKKSVRPLTSLNTEETRSLTLLSLQNTERGHIAQSGLFKGETSASSPHVATRVGPKTLASREAMRQQMLLTRLDSSLANAQSRLDRASAGLDASQRRLDEFTSNLRAAMMGNDVSERGLNPFVRVAQRYKGTPYVWGGESARGFDCSGFIMRVMRDLGYRALPHSAAEQFTYGTPIAKGLLRPGDLVFFANTYKPGISHVGIYLGHGRFIHAANSKVGTIVSNLDEPKWVAHYAGARRLLPNRDA